MIKFIKERNLCFKIIYTFGLVKLQIWECQSGIIF